MSFLIKEIKWWVGLLIVLAFSALMVLIDILMLK